LILSDRWCFTGDGTHPCLLATAGLHHHLIAPARATHWSRARICRTARVHHFALLIATLQPINPYLAYETVDDLIHEVFAKTDQRRR